MLPANHPSFWAGWIGVVLGMSMMAFGGYLFLNSSQVATLNIAIIVVGLIQVASSFFSLRMVRVAWAFALSINGTAAIVTLFAAPRIRDAAEVSILVALLPCLLFAAIVLLHSFEPKEFSGVKESP